MAKAITASGFYGKHVVPLDIASDQHDSQILKRTISKYTRNFFVLRQ